MRALGNLVWLVFGGGILGLAWWVVGAACFLLVVGIPWGRACFVMGTFSFFPFGKEAISRKDLTQKDDIGTGIGGTVGNIVWFLCFRLWLALLGTLIGLLNCLTIVGIPFGLQYFKIAGIAIAPIGKTIVSKEVAAEARRRNAEAEVAAIRQSA